eukprot:GHVU01099701.1.p1 GENE.GHVU01099701.1~~GHVU01099701.1.p1  ORF type:complete len:137 (+),score=23.91 GHVU01099701.1:295-705(+)
MEEELGIGHLDLEPGVRHLVETEVAAQAAERRQIEGEIFVRLRALGASKRFVARLSTYLRALPWSRAAENIPQVGGNDYSHEAQLEALERENREAAQEKERRRRDELGAKEREAIEAAARRAADREVKKRVTGRRG